MAAIMLMGTGSDVGKSLVVAGLLRLFYRRGIRVAPFKPQNMSNNAAVCPGGGEIGRAQALQSRACMLEPEVKFNPILLKPQSELGSQVVLMGQKVGNVSSREYKAKRAEFKDTVNKAFTELCSDYDLVVVEGAGSASEINLRENDVANFGFASDHKVPVVVVADIERGGIIASLVGTQVVVDDADGDLIKGFIVNKFKGDESLFDSARQFIVDKTGWCDLGILPYYKRARFLPQEDSQSFKVLNKPIGKLKSPNGKIVVRVIAYPFMSNFDEFQALAVDDGCDFSYIDEPGFIVGADLVILPGSKSVISDLCFLESSNFIEALLCFRQEGGVILGLCGGFQMLGNGIHDDLGIESLVKFKRGLGVLDIVTRITDNKKLELVEGFFADRQIKGYLMHLGLSETDEVKDGSLPQARQLPFLNIVTAGELVEEGLISELGDVFGCYLHGLFDNHSFRQAFLSGVAEKRNKEYISSFALDYEEYLDDLLDDLAGYVEEKLDCQKILKLAGCSTKLGK